MKKKDWKEGNCTDCGLKQNCLIEKDKYGLYFWKCVYCDEVHRVSSYKEVYNNQKGGE